MSRTDRGYASVSWTIYLKWFWVCDFVVDTSALAFLALSGYLVPFLFFESQNDVPLKRGR